MKRTIFTGFCRQIALSGILFTLITLMMPAHAMNTEAFPGILLPYGALVYFINVLLSRKEHSMLLLIGCNLAAEAAFVLGFWSGGLVGSGSELTGLVLAASVLTICGGRNAYAETGLVTLLRYLDGAAVTALILLLAGGETGILLLNRVPILAVCVLLLAAVMLLRRENGLDTRAVLMTAGVSLGVFLLALFFSSYLAEPAGRTAAAIWRALVNSVRFVLRTLWRLLLWFGSLFPDPENPAEEETLEAWEVKLPEEAAAAEDPVGSLVAAIVLTTAALVGLFFLIRLLHRIRIGGKRKKKAAKTSRRNTVSLRTALRTAWERFLEKRRQRRYIRRHRDEAGGLFLWLVRRFGVTPFARKRFETPREYLSRLAERIEKAELAAYFADLIPRVDAAFYSAGKQAEALSYAPVIRREVRREIRRGTALRWRKSLRERIKKSPVTGD